MTIIHNSIKTLACGVAIGRYYLYNNLINERREQRIKSIRLAVQSPRKGLLMSVTRDVKAGEVVVCKISGKVVSAYVLSGGNAAIKVRNLATGKTATLKTLKAIRAITMKVS